MRLLTVPDGDRAELERRAWSKGAPARVVERARIVLLAGDGMTGAQIAERAGCTKPTVIKWRRQYAESGLAGLEDYIRCFRDPGTIAGSCADYRSAAGIDLVHDEQTFAAGQKVECPVLALWGTQSFVGRGYEPLSIWQQYATDVRGNALPVGHFLPEEAPELVTAALRNFSTSAAAAVPC